MAHVAQATNAPFGAVAPLHMGSLFSHFYQAYQAWSETRETRRVLQGLSDQQLNDIGLTRGDI